MSVPAHVGDVGLILRATIKDENNAVVDVSTAITKQIKVCTPAGVTTAKTAAFLTTGVDGVIQYATVAGDISIRGRWRAEAYIVTAARSFHTSIHDFDVEDILA